MPKFPPLHPFPSQNVFQRLSTIDDRWRRQDKTRAIDAVVTDLVVTNPIGIRRARTWWVTVRAVGSTATLKTRSNALWAVSMHTKRPRRTLLGTTLADSEMVLFLASL